MMRVLSGIMGILPLGLMNICRFLLSRFRDSNVAHMFVDDGCFYGSPHLLPAG